MQILHAPKYNLHDLYTLCRFWLQLADHDAAKGDDGIRATKYDGSNLHQGHLSSGLLQPSYSRFIFPAIDMRKLPRIQRPQTY